MHMPRISGRGSCMQVDIADAQCCARSASGRSVVEALPRSAPKHKLSTGSTGACRRRAYMRTTHPQLIRNASEGGFKKVECKKFLLRWMQTRRLERTWYGLGWSAKEHLKELSKSETDSRRCVGGFCLNRLFFTQNVLL